MVYCPICLHHYQTWIHQTWDPSSSSYVDALLCESGIFLWLRFKVCSCFVSHFTLHTIHRDTSIPFPCPRLCPSTRWISNGPLHWSRTYPLHHTLRIKFIYFHRWLRVLQWTHAGFNQVCILLCESFHIAYYPQGHVDSISMSTVVSI
jgi:hypothetical protein